jgi:hypothetical protein
MNPENTTPPIDEADALIDEVRAIRRSISEEFGNDVYKLSEHLLQIEEEFRTRAGRLANVPRTAEGESPPSAEKAMT